MLNNFKLKLEESFHLRKKRFLFAHLCRYRKVHNFWGNGLIDNTNYIISNKHNFVLIVSCPSRIRT